MVITLVIASAGIYFGCNITSIWRVPWSFKKFFCSSFSDQFLKNHLPLGGEGDKDNVFKGEFVVTEGDFIPIASDRQGLDFVPTQKSRFYSLKLDQILSASHLSKSFLFNEVLLLEGLGTEGVRVHFNIHMSPQDQNVTATDIYNIIRRQIETKKPNESFLAEVDIDPESLKIKGKSKNYLKVPQHRLGVDFRA